jgi:hypothetical protein
MFDRLRWLKSTDNNLKSEPQSFWKYIYNFRKHRSCSIHLVVDGAHLVEPSAVADFFVSVCFFPSTRAQFVIGSWAVELPRK